ncbi:nitrogen regulatory protein PII [Aequitasia blattaphilus]|uniref:Transcriptional regulator n=1 Tax=Aequitasia blattaphilus TaxID=2949332 RepID=A0ABT1E9C8_9FIRM|nr:hypothetical protein [Aequitasia blattaphilus]MCP1101597.1 hypothetical protein [Aequitasia blattaphilus]MCR8614237.1 hypothetical protein [Aequitasia blattaphilus]
MAEKNKQCKQRMSLLISIVDRGRGNSTIKLYMEHNLFCHTFVAGEGTASAKMMDMLGLDVQEKDLIISIGSTKLIQCILDEFGNDRVSRKIKSSGIVFSMGLDALNSLVAIVINEPVIKENYCGVRYMDKDKKNNSLIVVSINQGYTDEMMKAARKAGARGGTIVRGRWADGEHLEQYHGITLQDEREMVFILTTSEKKNEIMDTINQDFGLMSDANGIICSVPVEAAVKLN